MTGRQVDKVGMVLAGESPWPPAIAVHHGDCKGSDAQFHAVATGLRWSRDVWRVIHPPTYGGLRAGCVGDEIRPVKDYLTRNRNIVDECTALVAAPNIGPQRGHRSGTWYTIRYAAKMGRPTMLIWPDGRVEYRGPNVGDT